MPALHTLPVTHPSAPAPRRWVLFLHGILGSGINWRRFAQQWVQAQPSWGALLVDLRLHGDSQGFAPPHTLAAAAADLLALQPPGVVDAVVGHSFGGKVALEYVRLREGALAHAVILDASPGTRIDPTGSELSLQAFHVLEHAGAVPNRAAFVARAREAGLSTGVAQWLAMNGVQRGDRFAVKLDLPAVRTLLADYFARDLWPVVEAPPGRVRFDVVLGGRSQVWGAADRARLEAIAERAPDRVRVHTLPEAGHWLHVDDPQGMAAILLQVAQAP